MSLPAGHLLSEKGAARALASYLRQMTRIQARIRFMSLEPLWFDAGQVLEKWAEQRGSLPFEWVIVGAATNGRIAYQPEPVWVERVVGLMEDLAIPVFFKGNLKWSPWWEEFPQVEPVQVELRISESIGLP